ncbi:MAG: alanine--tRNA ligase [Ruminococcaceae bacterium]|nr:alanine--tRNA ligase [Oscillospiraceae bacterium]
MKWTSLNDLREQFLSFFESKGHLRLKSFSLIPVNDISLLLINSGMAPMKKYFTGEEEPPRHRVCTCQKCIRTGDIDNVGKTARHGTFFEMLGNFSFGDYFKTEAIQWSWEFLTQTLEIPAERLYPSIYEEDDEAFELWNKVVGVPAEKIVRMGKADNFWEHGSGPCGPCSEIYYDRGEKYACSNPNCYPGCECDRYIEIWNNVFSQFNNDGNGNYTELETKNIDTGMGLERLACVMQDVDNLFEVDTVRKILDTVCSIASYEYTKDAKKDVSVRVITDHIRSATFMISDGVLPSNEGRGYVLRRLLRRAARHGKLLGINGSFLTTLCDVAIGESGGAYPELCEKQDYIKKIISMEEERFEATIDSGLSILSGFIAEAKQNGEAILSGENAFKLYDTFGFPPDLTAEIAEENGIAIDNEGFTALMKEQKERARAARADLSSWESADGGIISSLEKTCFEGYANDSVPDCKVLAIIVDGEAVDTLNEGSASIILDKTPFYGEGGGQVGDCGTLENEGFKANVTDTKKTDGVYIHLCDIENGSVKVGDILKASVCSQRRAKIRRNHSSVHLLQAALRKVLGNHVEQAGSYVDENRARFDFNHFAAVTPEEIRAVEKEVNESIFASLPIETVETDIESARAAGAMALFGEKYGKTVRMVKMGDVSVELCGGTHADNTASLGLFRIISESGIAAGVRRIEAVCASGVLALLDERDSLIADTAASLKAQNSADMPRRAQSLHEEIAKLKKEIDSLNSKLASGKLDGILSGAKAVGAVKLAVCDLGATGVDGARSLCDQLRDKDSSLVAVLAIHDGEKLNFLATAGADAVKAGAHAGKLVGAVAQITGGKGGGRPDSAMSGGKDLSKLSEALEGAEAILAGMLK